MDAAGRICHEMRKPLTAVRAFAEILADRVSGPLNTDQVEHVSAVLRNAERMDEQLCTLFEFAEALCGRLHLELGSCHLEALCAQVRDEVAQAFLEKEVRLLLDTSEPVVHDRIDSARLRRVLRRVLHNALRVSQPGGSVTLRLASRPGVAFLVVEDDGPGLAAGEAETIFEPFAGGRQRLESGLGISLYLCRAALAAHGGGIRAENDVRGGARFFVELPLSSDLRTP